MTELHKPVIVTDGGPWAEHDHACAVCRERKSIIYLDTGVFQPCDPCRRQGWFVVKQRGWLRRWWQR